ncbi:sensor domain-containing protein [Dokdonella immobilis]|uniref:Sensor protein n=1 Tax=Dokdonella immobilis TaxID=578942 RepID=A0A1I4XCK3_9GAMM|nr:sensor domain-containing protein [Dokdonella immobilis]SFN23505.1 sensor protein [Dokdonella immobilis]
MSQAIPRTIPEYLDQLRSALRGADPAMIQDALYDAEEHLRAELAEHPELDEAAMLARVATSYGAPDEVAEIYRVKEGEVEQALRPRRRQPVAEKSLLARFFGVAVDPRAYLALFYMVLTLATGIFYFTWVVAGLGMSAGFAILIIGIPFIILFFATVRALSFVEGKIVEAMLGVRMPRRPQAMQPGGSIWQRIGAMFTDPRTWSTLFYMLLMMPLGVLYFCIVTIGFSFAIGLTLAPFVHLFSPYGSGIVMVDGDYVTWSAPLWSLPFVFVGGVLLFFVMLHIVRGIGQLHGQLAKHLLVKAG